MSNFRVACGMSAYSAFQIESRQSVTGPIAAGPLSGRKMAETDNVLPTLIADSVPLASGPNEHNEGALPRQKNKSGRTGGTSGVDQFPNPLSKLSDLEGLG